MQGYIKLYRKMMCSPIWQDPYYFKLWMYCLMKASHKEHEQLVGNLLEKLKPGQFITGRKVLTEELNKGMKNELKLSEKSWERYLKNLEKWKMLTIKTTNKYSVVTIIKWYEYQETDQQLTNSCPTTDQQLTTNKNVKNDKNVKNNNIPLEIENFRHRYSENQLKVIDDYLEMIRHTRVSAKISDSVIAGMYKEWDKYPIVCVEYGLKTHTKNPSFHSKKENYTFGIIRNTTADEAVTKLGEVKKNSKQVDWEGFDLE